MSRSGEGREGGVEKPYFPLTHATTMLFRLVVVPSVVLSMTNWVNLSHDAMHEMLEVVRCLWE